MAHNVGLLVGRERAFPDALIAEVNRRGPDVVASYAKLDVTRFDRPPAYDVLVDRISHDVACYQPVLKLAALYGVRVVNNPFWRIADDKFFDAALAHRLGIRSPKTYVLPSHSYTEDVTTDSLTNLNYPIDWEGMIADLGFPLYLKPHWGGGWRDVHKVHSKDELIWAYNQSGRRTMIAQEAIEWQQYVRCIVIGKEDVLPALWDPRLFHYDRYVRAAESMPALGPETMAQVVDQSKRLCAALGYDMNTVEWAVRDGVPYAIDFMNSAPDFDISSLGESHFRWTVERMADLVIRLARTPEQASKQYFAEVLR